jgi:hypothetical protein
MPATPSILVKLARCIDEDDQELRMAKMEDLLLNLALLESALVILHYICQARKVYEVVLPRSLADGPNIDSNIDCQMGFTFCELDGLGVRYHRLQDCSNLGRLVDRQG